MSKKKHIYPNGTKVEIYFEGEMVGTGKIIDHLLEPDDVYPSKTHLYYRVEVEQNELGKFIDMNKEHWLNDFEVKPIR